MYFLGENKAAISERVQRTLANMLSALFMSHIKFDIFQLIRRVTNLYNNKINLYDQLTPKKRIFSREILLG